MNTIDTKFQATNYSLATLRLAAVEIVVGTTLGLVAGALVVKLMLLR